MNKPQDKVVREIFLSALDKGEGTEREAYLAQACGQDEALPLRVEVLLTEHQRAGSFLEEPLGPVFESPMTSANGLSEQPGETIGPYKLLEQIGEGGCGVVYLAEQREPIRRRVALKVIKLGMDTRRVIARFEAERQALALMEHPNIAKVFDAGATETGRPYFVMELVRGIKITDYCDEHQLSTEERLALFVQICHAIQHAHQKGIIHRDIKPSNILVTRMDGQPVPKVIDFGIAKATGGEVLTDKTIFTAFEQFIGTPAYMSPEQVELTGQDIDTRSDIYSLGVLLYELLTSQTPFDHKELVAAGLDEMRRVIREQEPLRPSTKLTKLVAASRHSAAGEDRANGDALPSRRYQRVEELVHSLRGDLDWIVMKCLEKSRSRRYETANGLAEDVSRHLHDEPVSARPPGKLYRFQKLVQRNKLAFGAVAAVLAALLIGLGISTWLAIREQLARKRAVEAEKQAQSEAKKSQQVARFLKDMLEGVGPWVALGRDTTLLKEILDKTAERAGKELKDQPEVQAEVLSTLGNVYLDLGQRTNGAAMHRTALDLRKKIYGDFNTNVANSLDGIGRALLWQDNADEAEAYLQEALIIRTNLLGPNNLQVADSLARLGRLRFLQCRASEGEPLYRRCLDIRRKFLGIDHAYVVSALEGLYLCLRDQDRLGEAEKVAREMVEIQTRLSGAEKSIGIEVVGGALADILVAQNRMAEAEVPSREHWLACRRFFGEDSVQAIQAAVGYFVVLDANGNSAEALALLRETEARSKRVFGSGYPTLWCLACAGDVLRNAGRLAEAEKTYRESVSSYERLPYRSDREARTRSCLFEVLRAQGKDDDIESYLNNNLVTQRQIHTAVAREREADLLNQLAIRRKGQGRLNDAEALYYDALRILDRLSTNSSPVRLNVAAELVYLLKDQGKLEQAESVDRQNVDLARKLNAPNELALALDDLAGVLQEEGNAAEAEAAYLEGLDIYRKLSPSSVDQRIRSLFGLATIVADRGNLHRAGLLVLEAVTNIAGCNPDFDGVLINVPGQKLKADVAVQMFNHLAASGEVPAYAQYTFCKVGGAVLARLGLCQAAIPYQTKALGLIPTNQLLWEALAAELAYAGETNAYCRLFQQALKQFSGITCEPLAKAFSLLPSGGIDKSELDRWAQQTAAGPLPAANPWVEEALRLVHYRMGRFAQAIQGEDKLGFGADAVPEREITTRCVLAMAHHRLNEMEKAQAELDKAIELGRTKLKQVGTGELGPVWSDWYIAQVMLREAKGLIRSEGYGETSYPHQAHE